MFRNILSNITMFQIEKDNNQSDSCINGYYDKITNKCICYPGWKTLSELNIECTFDIGLNKTNNLRNVLKNNTIPYFENTPSSHYFLIFLCIFIHISLLFILKHYYNKCKNKYKDEQEKIKEHDSYMTEKDKILYEMNYLDSSSFFIPTYYPYSVRSNNPSINEEKKKNISNKKKYLEDDNVDKNDIS